LTWVALGAGLLALFVWLGRRSERLEGSEWRAAVAVLAVEIFIFPYRSENLPKSGAEKSVTTPPTT